MDNRPIGMFDSGVGGITIYKEVKKRLPKEDIIYLGDTKRFPYGSKSKESIINLTKKGIDFLLSKNVKAVIIACGTATSQALEEVKKIYNIPIIGIIEPTVKYLTSKDNIKTIGVVATRGTIRSNCWENSLLKEKPDLKVINKECPLLASMAEEGWTENEIARLTVHEYMKDVKNIDALILGCTHYPLFTKLFKNEVGKNTEIINTGTIVADFLEKNVLLNKEKKIFEEKTSSDNNSKIFLTDTECNFINVTQKLLGNLNTEINSEGSPFLAEI